MKVNTTIVQLIGQNENDVIVISLNCPKCVKEVIRYNSNWRYIWYISFFISKHLHILIYGNSMVSRNLSKIRNIFVKLLRPHLTLFGILVPILESSSIYMNLWSFLQISWMHYVIFYNFKDHSSSEIWHIFLRKCYRRVSRKVFSKL